VHEDFRAELARLGLPDLFHFLGVQRNQVFPMQAGNQTFQCDVGDAAILDIQPQKRLFVQAFGDDPVHVSLDVVQIGQVRLDDGLDFAPQQHIPVPLHQILQR